MISGCWPRTLSLEHETSSFAGGPAWAGAVQWPSLGLGQLWQVQVFFFSVTLWYYPYSAALDAVPNLMVEYINKGFFYAGIAGICRYQLVFLVGGRYILGE